MPKIKTKQILITNYSKIFCQSNLNAESLGIYSLMLSILHRMHMIYIFDYGISYGTEDTRVIHQAERKHREFLLIEI